VRSLKLDKKELDEKAKKHGSEEVYKVETNEAKK